MRNSHGAYIRPDVALDKLAGGPLDGLSFAVKDVFAVRGHVSGAGSPDWARSHPEADRHAAAIERLLASGARLEGLTHTDELMFSLNGENYHYGTPINPRAERRIAGGSSSGSAVAVASGLADFALGTDTGGSVRIPSSYCGLYGFRPTHGRISMEGVVPLAPSFDTVGWMAGSAKLLALAGEALLQEEGNCSGVGKDAGFGFGRLIVAKDALAVADMATREAMRPLLEELAADFSVCESLGLAEEGLPEWMSVFKIVQGAEIWQVHGEWVERTKPRFGPGIAERFAWVKTIGADESRARGLQMADIRQRLRERLGDDGVLAIPTAPGAAPLRNTRGAELEDRRSRTLQLCCIAGLGGLPQLTLPLAEVEGCPVGLSLIAGPGGDERLLRWAERFESRRKAVGTRGARRMTQGEDDR
ncbi:amidase [Paenibacillaceae bacterium WGS1546]|uniref:amidase n=1 Tax=Cohnella sp. WGS1546 TaxID=3366810 RepID=UPI00372D56AD